MLAHCGTRKLTCHKVHAYSIRECVIHDIDILGEAIRDTAERCGVEERHWGLVVGVALVSLNW
jgi:hypothetical protein